MEGGGGAEEEVVERGGAGEDLGLLVLVRVIFDADDEGFRVLLLEAVEGGKLAAARGRTRGPRS